ncbi:MAG: LemA family protein [Phycisphaerales bacterium]|jgi:LemA protein|nr:LemA family protein [Phycisphaerales bacterium]
MNGGVVVLIVVGVTVLVPLIWLIATYNRFVSLRTHMSESWHDVDVELKRRHDLIPNLVETVKGYAAHERETFDRVIEARARAMAHAGPDATLGRDESELARGVGRLFALAEGYPDLKASENFLALQKELALTEDRIAAARRFFNANVRELNQLCGMFPTNIVAGMFGFHPAAFFELSSEAERVVPRVSI